LHNYKTNRYLPNSPNCVNPVAEQRAFGEKLGVNGTPAIFFENVSLGHGGNNPKELLGLVQTYEQFPDLLN